MLPRLKQLRLESRLKQKDISDILGVNLTTYNRYECGALNIALDKLCILADFYGVSTDYLLNRVDGPVYGDVVNISADFVRKYNDLDVRGRAVLYAVLAHEYKQKNQLDNLN